MSADRRILIVARHYWPTTNDESLGLRFLAGDLVRHGCTVDLVTPQWGRMWPPALVAHQVRVHRLAPAPAGRAETARYHRNLVARIVQSLPKTGLIYCDAIDEDAHGIVRGLPRALRIPLIVRYATGGSNGPAIGRLSDAKTREVCERASLVVVRTIAAKRHLIALGVRPQAVRLVDDCPGATVCRTAASRRDARRVLASTNYALHCRDSDRLIVCPGELTREWNIDFLIRSVRPLIERHRSLCLWILGDGPERERVYERLQFEGLHRLVALPGVFTDLELVFQAADLCVLTAPNRGHRYLLPSCRRNGLPVLVAETTAATPLPGTPTNYRCYPERDTRFIRAWIERWLAEPASIARGGGGWREQAAADARGASPPRLATILENAMSPPSTSGRKRPNNPKYPVSCD